MPNIGFQFHLQASLSTVLFSFDCIVERSNEFYIFCGDYLRTFCLFDDSRASFMQITLHWVCVSLNSSNWCRVLWLTNWKSFPAAFLSHSLWSILRSPFGMKKTQICNQNNGADNLSSQNRREYAKVLYLMPIDAIHDIRYRSMAAFLFCI